MSGRIEKEAQARKEMEARLATLPDIITIFYNWLDARERSYTTMYNYVIHVTEFMNFIAGDGEIADDFYKHVTDVDIERYMVFIRRRIVNGKEVENGECNRAAKWSAINTFFKFLSQKKYIDNNPMTLTERPRIRKKNEVVYMTKEEIESVFSRIIKESRPMLKNRDYCIVALGLGTGLRVSAIVNINMEDIDFATNTIKVIEKGRKIRNIVFADSLRSLLLVWIKDRELYFDGESTGPLFLSQFKTRMSVDGVEGLVKKYTSHLSKKITPHKLRSSAAMNLHGMGVDILTIAAILGHENVTTTQRYTRAYDESIKNAIDALDKHIL